MYVRNEHFILRMLYYEHFTILYFRSSYASNRNPYGRSITPTPNQTFGSRATTPTPPRPSTSTPRATSTPKAPTPNRSGRLTPGSAGTGRTTPTLSGRTTPTAPGMANGPRRLPTTPKTRTAPR